MSLWLHLGSILAQVRRGVPTPFGVPLEVSGNRDIESIETALLPGPGRGAAPELDRGRDECQNVGAL